MFLYISSIFFSWVECAEVSELIFSMLLSMFSKALMDSSLSISTQLVYAAVLEIKSTDHSLMLFISTLIQDLFWFLIIRCEYVVLVLLRTSPSLFMTSKIFCLLIGSVIR